jgi:hypothetical protein
MNKAAMTVLIYPIPDGADPREFAPFSKRLKRKPPSWVDWEVGNMYVIAMQQVHFRSMALQFELDVRDRSLEILRMLGGHGRGFMEREDEYRFGWFPCLDARLGLYFVLCVCDAEEAEWMIRRLLTESGTARRIGPAPSSN